MTRDEVLSEIAAAEAELEKLKKLAGDMVNEVSKHDPHGPTKLSGKRAKDVLKGRIKASKASGGSVPIRIDDIPADVLLPYASTTMSASRITNAANCYVRKELMWRGRVEYLLKTFKKGNRNSYENWVRQMFADFARGLFTGCLIHLITDDNGQPIDGEHTLRALMARLGPNDYTIVNVLCNVPLKEIAHAEGVKRPQGLGDRVYRIAEIEDKTGKSLILDAISGLIRSGKRAAGLTARIDPAPVAKYLLKNHAMLVSMSQFKTTIRWLRGRGAVFGAFLRVRPHVRPNDWAGAMQVYLGLVPVPGQQFSAFQALQNYIIQGQGVTSSESDAWYFFSTLHAWAIFLGIMKKDLGIRPNLTVVQNAAVLATALAAHKVGPGLPPPTVGLTQLELPPLDYLDKDVQDGLLKIFPWTAQQKCGLPIP